MSNIDRSTAATGTGANIATPPAVAPVAAGMQDLSLGEKLVHEPERVIQHAPLFEKEVLSESTLGVQREHHIQPVVHETEHLIQPIIKTQATAERPILEQDKNVMHAPIVQPAVLPAGLEAVDRVGPEGIVHRPKLAKDVVVEKPVQVLHEHHVQPIIHEREHHIQPIVKTDVTAEQRLLETQRNVVLPPIVEPPVMVGTVPSLGTTAPVQAQAPILPAGGQPVATTATTTIPRTAGLAQAPLPAPQVTKTATNLGGAPLGGANAGMLDTEERMPSAAGLVAPELPGETEVYNKDLGAGKGVGTTADETTTGHATIGQKLKGALKEVTGTITRNPAKREEGKMLMHGVDPATGSTTGL